MVLRSLEKKEKKGQRIHNIAIISKLTSSPAWENDWKKFEDKTISVVGNLETLRKFNGKGAENVRHAACEVNLKFDLSSSSQHFLINLFS